MNQIVPIEVNFNDFGKFYCIYNNNISPHSLRKHLVLQASNENELLFDYKFLVLRK